MTESILGRVLGRREVDPVQAQLGQVLGDIGAGPHLVEHRGRLFNRIGVIVSATELMTHERSGDRSLQLSLEYPNPNDSETTEAISIGATQVANTGETLVYIASNGQIIFHASPNDEELDRKLEEALEQDFIRRADEERLPQHVLRTLTEIPSA